jgi:competence protein ComEC
MSAQLGSASPPKANVRGEVSERAKLPPWLTPAALKLHYYRFPMLWILLAMLVGNSTRNLLTTTAWVASVISLPLLMFGAAACYRRGHRSLSAVLVLFAAALFAAAYGRTFQPNSSDSLYPLATRQAEPIALRGVICSVAEWFPNLNHRPEDASSQPWQTRWELRCEAVRDGGDWQTIDALTTLTVAGRIDDLLPGDEVEVFGGFRQITPPTNPGGYDFAERARQQGQFWRVSADRREQITKLGERNTFPLLRLRGHAVRWVDGYLHSRVAFDQAPLAAALIFGQRSQVNWEEREELMATGTLHLLAISGLHVGILAGAVMLACGMLQTRNFTEFIWVCCICGLYAALAGGQPPVLRAVVLIALFAIARVWGRRTRLLNLLSVAAIVLLLIQAHHATDVGVHLSFLAVGSIGIFAGQQHGQSQRRAALQSVLEESYSRWFRRWLMWQRGTLAAIQLSFWVWLMTCPLIWTNFNVISPIAIPLNVMIAVPLTISLLSGLILSAFGWLAPVAWLAGQACGGSLALISWIVSLGSAIPLGHFWLPAPPLAWTVSFYALTLGWLVAFGPKRRKWLGILLTLWVVGGVSWFGFGPRGYLTGLSVPTSSLNAPVGDELRLTFIDVGHGTSVIVEFPSQQVWLYDAGHFGAPETSHQDIAAALWDLPTARIANLIISHADADHYNATRGLLERFNIEAITSTRRFWNSDKRDVIALHQTIEAHRVGRSEWQAGAMGNEGDVEWQVLHPADSLAAESDNSSSLCLLLEYAGKRVLLPGDLEGSGLLNLVKLPERPCHALMAPHHGSMSHDPSELIAWCRPEVIVISGNQRAVRPQVLEKYSQPGANLGITFREGAIQLRIHRHGELTSWHWQQDQWQPLLNPTAEN